MTPETAGRIHGWSKPNWRWTSGRTVRNPAPSTGPIHAPVPPTIANSNASSARSKPNCPAEMNRVKWANRTPASPATAPEITNAYILWRTTSTPDASAAISSSRTAASPRPRRVGRMRANTQASRAVAIQTWGIPTSFGIPRRPCAPPVMSRLMARIRTTSPNPRVAIARYTPRRRSTGRPTTNAATAPTPIPTTTTTARGRPTWIVNSAEV